MIRSTAAAIDDLPAMSARDLRVVNLLAAADRAEMAYGMLRTLDKAHPMRAHWLRVLGEAEALAAANGGWAIVHTTPPV